MERDWKPTGIILLLVVLGTLSLVYLGALAPEFIPTVFPVALTGNVFVDEKLAYQVVTLGGALVILAAAYALAPQNARRFYGVGNLKAPAQPVRWLDIKPGETWLTVGRNFAVVISLVTAVFIYFNIAQGQSVEPGNVWLLLFIPLLAAMNAFTEEAITRLAVVVALDGLVTRPTIYLISALIFGIPHFFGVPGGVLGTLMAGFLGWLLAKSIIETEGLFWAWFIHFLQDVIIFSGLFLLAL